MNLHAREIIERLGDGSLDVGFSGLDLLKESKINTQNKIRVIKKLDFGNAKLVVAIPDPWIDVQTIADLEEIAFEFRDKFNQIIGDVGKILLVLGGIFIASKVGIGRLLASIVSFNFKLIRFNAVNLLLAPFRMIGNIIRAILVRAARFAPWLLPTLSALGGGEVEGQQSGDTNMQIGRAHV